MERETDTIRTAIKILRLLCVVVGIFALYPRTAFAQQIVDPFLSADFVANPQAVVQDPAVRLASAYSAENVILDNGAYVQPAYNYQPAQPTGPIDMSSYSTYCSNPNIWSWQLLPDGLIYRSYQAGPRESRFALHTIHNSSSTTGNEWLWDATLGGRRGVVRFGSTDPSDPRGWQLDIEGAANVRLNLDENRDVDASDFRFGVPLTYTNDGKTHYKFAYYHVSSHLGDEFIARTGVNSRINYVRDALQFGISHEINDYLRVYGEVAYAFFTAGGAEPWEFQFGAEYSKPGPTGMGGTPFVATNAHLREELDFSGDWTLQTGWLWRGVTGSTFRAGLHYMNGKSTNYQFFNANEEQVGFGIWYDY